MFNSAPYEILAAPFTLYVAEVGTAFPDVDTLPGAGWTKVGTSGDRNASEEGVAIEHGHTVNVWRAAGSTGPRKAWRTEESMMVRMTLVDLSLEQYALALNHNAVTNTPAGAGTPGTKKIGLSRGTDLVQKALLVRGPSPYMENGAAQYEIPVAIQQGAPAPVFQKGEPAGLALEWQALEDPDAASDDERFGRLVAQTEDAET